MSRSDFLTYSTYAALDVATDINNRDCGLTDPDCRMPEMEYREVARTAVQGWDVKRSWLQKQGENVLTDLRLSLLTP